MNELTPFKKFIDRYGLSPGIVFGKSLLTTQFTIGTTPTRIIEGTFAKFYMIASIDTMTTVFIGGPGVSITSGFAVTPQLSPFVFAMTENAELWAVSSGSVVLFLADFGI
jgi:hypothetical protein